MPKTSQPLRAHDAHGTPWKTARFITYAKSLISVREDEPAPYLQLQSERFNQTRTFPRKGRSTRRALLITAPRARSRNPDRKRNAGGSNSPR